ncbi:hypothetical protein BGW41_001077 [Actinomortierella wolfii]|nr:hypothetical protein BGW41_001077 [Actinomortierella wolfii]
MLRKANGYFEYQPVTPPGEVPMMPAVKGFQTIERHVDQGLENETAETLNKRIKAELVVMCQERGIPTEGDKQTLVQALLDWQQAKPVPAPSTPKLCSVEPVMAVKKAPINTVYLNSLLMDENFHGEIAYEQLQIGRKLGSGGFKDCYEGKYMGEPVAIGELRVQNFTEMDITEMKHEINVLRQLRHENIIRFIGVCTNIKHLCIVTELCENGDLYDFMRKSKKPSFGQLISADFRAKINDFGLARIRPRANASLHTQCGTPNWQAPEFWTSNPSYTEKVDVYACGLIYWEILSWSELGYPYHHLTEHQLYEAVRDREERPPLEKLRKYPQSLLALIQEMWRKDPKRRPSMSHVVERLAEYLTGVARRAARGTTGLAVLCHKRTTTTTLRSNAAVLSTSFSTCTPVNTQQTSTTSSSSTNTKRARTEKFLDPATNRDKFLVGTPHPVSNLRPVLYPIPDQESEADRQLREQRERVDAFNQDFWSRNNALFNQAKAEYEAKIIEKNGGTPVTTEELSVFYKDFLDKAYDRQMAYNKQWWIENIGLLWPSAKAVFRRLSSRS